MTDTKAAWDTEELAEFLRGAGWLPIAEYDALKKKPPAVFLFAPTAGRYTGDPSAQDAMVRAERNAGYRVCIGWAPHPAIPKGLPPVKRR
jgi:hypothetical protein